MLIKYKYVQIQIQIQIQCRVSLPETGKHNNSVNMLLLSGERSQNTFTQFTFWIFPHIFNILEIFLHIFHNFQPYWKYFGRIILMVNVVDPDINTFLISTILPHINPIIIIIYRQDHNDDHHFNDHNNNHLDDHLMIILMLIIMMIILMITLMII